MRGLRRETEGFHVAETVREAQDPPPPLGLRTVKSNLRIRILGCCHIGGTAQGGMGGSAQYRGKSQRYDDRNSFMTNSSKERKYPTIRRCPPHSSHTRLHTAPKAVPLAALQ